MGQELESRVAVHVKSRGGVEIFFREQTKARFHRVVVDVVQFLKEHFPSIYIHRKRVSLPDLEFSVLQVDLEMFQDRWMVLSQVKLNGLCGELEEVPLDILPFTALPHLPNHVQVVGHDGKTVYRDSPLPHEETHAVHQDVFVFVLFEQHLPFQDGGGEELRVVDDALHSSN